MNGIATRLKKGEVERCRDCLVTSPCLSSSPTLSSLSQVLSAGIHLFLPLTRLWLSLYLTEEEVRFKMPFSPC